MSKLTLKGCPATPGLEVINGLLLEKALLHYEGRNVDFIDGYIAAVMEKHSLTSLFSYDRKHVARLEGIDRIEP